MNTLIQKYPKDFRNDFAGWLASNQPIYAEFERQAKIIALFRDRYSARTIAEVIRHNSQLSEVGSEWKINNNRIPDMARLFSLRNPQHAQLFQLRNSEMRMGRAA